MDKHAIISCDISVLRVNVVQNDFKQLNTSY